MSLGEVSLGLTIARLFKSKSKIDTVIVKNDKATIVQADQKPVEDPLINFKIQQEAIKSRSLFRKIWQV